MKGQRLLKLLSSCINIFQLNMIPRGHSQPSLERKPNKLGAYKKTSITAFFFAVVCMLFVNTTSAQRSAAPKRDLEALDLLARCSSAMGSPGPETTVSSSGTIVPSNSVDASEAVALKSKGDSRTRWDLSSSAGTQSVVLNNGAGKSKHRSGEEKPMALWQTKFSRQEHFPALLCGRETERAGMEIVYAGLEKAGDTPVHHIAVFAAAQGRSKLADAIDRVASEFHIFLDAKSLVVVKTARFAFSAEAVENRSVLETHYSNYKQVNGVLMPFTIVRFLGGQKVDEISFDSVQLGVAIDDSEFSNN